MDRSYFIIVADFLLALRSFQVVQNKSASVSWFHFKWPRFFPLSILQFLFQGRNPGIAWEYSVPRPGADGRPGAQPSYTWAVVRSECSVSCGGGRSLVLSLLVVGAVGDHGAVTCAVPMIIDHRILTSNPGSLPEGGGNISRDRGDSSGQSVTWKPEEPAPAHLQQPVASRKSFSELVSAFHLI